MSHIDIAFTSTILCTKVHGKLCLSQKQEGIKVGRIQPVWHLYRLQFQWPHQMLLPGGTQINKFEQISSDHQISLRGGGGRSDAKEGVFTLPCDLSHDALMFPAWEETDTCEKIPFHKCGKNPANYFPLIFVPSRKKTHVATACS